MEFAEAIPVSFKEITPNHYNSEKWKEVVLNTGGTHSTLQDIKLPAKAGGYWYQDSKKASTRNRFIYWQTTPDAIELTEASLDINLSGANLRCKVAPGTPPLNGMSVWERPMSREVVILAATVSSVHRLVFPHPDVLDKKATFGSLSTTTPSIFHDTSSLNNPNNYFLLNQYSNSSVGVAHTCASMLRDNGEAVFALAFGYGGEGGLLLVKLPLAGAAVSYQLKRESTVPRFLSGITGALRGKPDGIETYGVVLTGSWAVAVCADASLRAWPLDEGGAPAAVSPPLAAQPRPRPPPHGHMLQKATAPDGGVVLVAYLSFPDESEFVVMRMHDNGAGALKFAQVCRIYGPQLDLLDYSVGYGEGTNVIWALWSQPDGETIITSSALNASVSWRSVAPREPPPPLPQLHSAQAYRDRLLAVGLFPPPVVWKALSIYRRTWGGGDSATAGELGECALGAVQARLRHLAARSPPAHHATLMHKCWSDLYSWCMQYMEGLQKPLGLMVCKHVPEYESGWWCAVVRRAGISLIRELEPLERMMLSNDYPDSDYEKSGASGSLSSDCLLVVAAARSWERAASVPAADELERQVFGGRAPQHRLLPRLVRLLTATPILTPMQIDELSAILEPIRDLQSAVLELNDALRLDVPELDTSKDEDECSEYDSLFSSDLGVAVVTEAIRQMAEMRSRIVRGTVAALGAARGADAVPGAGHCAVHWQAYRALLWLRGHCAAPSTSSDELFRLKLSALGSEPCEANISEGVMQAYVARAGGSRARRHLSAAGAPLDWHQALPLMSYHLAHQLWAVSGGFSFGWWLASINQPRVVQSYVALLEPWCEWTACSRQFILGLALLDLDEPEGAYSAFSKAAKGVGAEPFLRQLVASAGAPATQHQALVLYYMKVIKLFEIHDAGACVVRLAETAISIADKDDPNLGMFQWLVFIWHLNGGRVQRALSAAAASPAPHARAAAAAALLTTLAQRNQLEQLVTCGALSAEAERAAASRARLHDAHAHNPYYDFLYALHVHRHHYRKAASVMYERASRCTTEGGGRAARRRYLAAALTALQLAQPRHAFLCRAVPVQVIGIEELEAELREEDPDSMDAVQQALLTGESLDFNALYPQLKEAPSDTLLAVLKRVVTTGQYLPRWFIHRYMEVDSSGCIRALLASGRAVEAADACCGAFRNALRRLNATAPVAAAPLAAADLLRAELQHHRDDDTCREIYEELDSLVTEYKQVVVRTSDDMKLARIQFPIAT
ncbi:nuclear pore complex protein Nup160 homolog [Plutella xylostella]|uniref:nuclear pore complex protein Nup160 homolog n=1 Tax=Plutella xylostella TaxID=51655 RepID=UPI002032C5B6|nr:nuclear pore complex protein Nup160 homolog [Plutella xylostella]